MTDTITLDFPKIDAPFTTIVNRAKMVDLTKDLGVRKGVDRIMTQELIELPEEQGLNGEKVFGLVGDKYEQFRFVGDWKSETTTSGVNVFTTTVNDYVEIIDNGTGLNILGYMDVDAAPDWRASINNGVEGNNLYSTTSSILTGRQYGMNVKANVFSGLTKGVHNTKIRCAVSGTEGLRIYGFETLNESAQLSISQGEIQLNNLLLKSPSEILTDYKTGFESGIVGTNGGRAPVYIKPDGTIRKAINPVGTPLYLPNADHSNEKEVRRINFREFGADRADDFSTLSASGSNRAFTMPDNVTTLIGNNVSVPSVIAKQNGFGFGAVGSYGILTAICSGLDVTVARDDIAGDFSLEVFVDGTSRGIIGYSDIPPNENMVTVNVFSDLKYTTHRVKFIITGTFTCNVVLGDFVIYQPKTPAIPQNSHMIGSYNLMADFVHNPSKGLEDISVGVLRGVGTRGWVYTGTWNISLDIAYISGFQIFSNATSEQTASKSFNGTGFHFRGKTASGAATVQIFIDDVLVTAANFPLITVIPDTGVAYDNVGATINFNDGGAATNGGFAVTGLPDSEHTLKLRSSGSAAEWQVQSLDVITPIHSYKENKPNVKGVFDIGSQSVGDNRSDLTTTQYQSRTFKAVAKTSTPTITATSFVLCPDMVLPVHSNGEWFDIIFQGPFSVSLVGNVVSIALEIDGEITDHNSISFGPVAGEYAYPHTFVTEVFLTKGFHLIKGMWSVSAGIGEARLKNRVLSATTRNGEK